MMAWESWNLFGHAKTVSHSLLLHIVPFQQSDAFRLPPNKALKINVEQVNGNANMPDFLMDLSGFIHPDIASKLSPPRLVTFTPPTTNTLLSFKRYTQLYGLTSEL